MSRIRTTISVRREDVDLVKAYAKKYNLRGASHAYVVALNIVSKKGIAPDGSRNLQPTLESVFSEFRRNLETIEKIMERSDITVEEIAAVSKLYKLRSRFEVVYIKLGEIDSYLSGAPYLKKEKTP
jgi:hypothetical protein